MTAQPKTGALLALLSFGNFIIGMGAFVVIGIVSPIAEGLASSKAAVGIILTVYALAYAVASPIAVAATGRMARRNLLIGALALFLAGTIVSALAQSLWLLSASRVLAALGAALFTPVAAGVAVALSAPETRGKALATVFGGLTFAQVIGVPAGAWLAYRFGWEAAFWAVAALAVMGIATLVLAMPRDIHFQPTGLAAIAATLRDGKVLFATAFTASFMGAIYMVFTFFGPLIEASVGDNAELRSFYLVLFGLGAVAGNHAGGFLNDRIGSTCTLVILCLGQAALMPLFSIVPWSAALFAILVGVWSAFGWSFMAPQQARLVALAPQAQALVLALNAALLYGGIAIGSGLSSAVLGSFGLAGLGVAGGIGALVALAHLLASQRLARPIAAPNSPRF